MINPCWRTARIYRIVQLLHVQNYSWQHPKNDHLIGKLLLTYTLIVIILHLFFQVCMDWMSLLLQHSISSFVVVLCHLFCEVRPPEIKFHYLFLISSLVFLYCQILPLKLFGIFLYPAVNPSYTSSVLHPIYIWFLWHPVLLSAYLCLLFMHANITHPAEHAPSIYSPACNISLPSLIVTTTVSAPLN